MSVTFKKITFFREKRFWLALLLFVLTFLFIAFAPFLWAPKIAESGISSVQPNTTVLTQFNFLTPQYAVFNSTDNYGSQVSFIELDRVWLVWWQARTVSALNFSTPNNISDEQKKQLQQQNLTSLQNAVQSGRLTSNSPLPSYEMDELTRNLISEQNTNQQPGAERFSIQDSSQTHTIIVLNGLTYPENSVLLDGVLLPNVKNVFSVNFEQTSDTAKFIYFTSYEVFNERRAIEGNGEGDYGTVQFSGTIQRYSLESKQVETIHQTKAAAISVQANKNKVLFFSLDGANGVFDLATKEIQVVNLPNNNEGDEQGHGDGHEGFTEILNMSEETAVINVNQNALNIPFRVQLNSGEVTQIKF